MNRRPSGRSSSDRLQAWAVCLLLVAIFAGSAGAEPPASAGSAPEPDSEKALREAVMQWWDARDRKDAQAMYDLYEPAWRATTPFARFAHMHAFRIPRFTLADLRITRVQAEGPDRARVWLEYKGTVPNLGVVQSSGAQDTWTRVDGRWYKVFQPPAVPFVESPPASPPP
jgi:hypothetical protein